MLKYYLKQDNASPHTTLACFDKTQTLIKSLMEFLSDLKTIFFPAIYKPIHYIIY